MDSPTIDIDAILKVIANEIFLVAKEEERSLERAGTYGIFMMPEIAFVYQVGKSVMCKRRDIFGSEDIKWIRENKLGDEAGPIDLAFRIGHSGHLIVMEFKIARTIHDYKRDIEKVRRFVRGGDLLRVGLFVVLNDPFVESNSPDNRMADLELEDKVSMIFTDGFATTMSSHGYSKRQKCEVGVFRVV